MIARACVPLLAAAALCACTTGAPPPPLDVPGATAPQPMPEPPTATAGAAWPHYRCDQDIDFRVQFGDGTAVIDAGAHGKETLLRDAGGFGPAQTVYSSTRLKAEFGLGADGRGARLLFASPPLEARCSRDS